MPKYLFQRDGAMVKGRAFVRRPEQESEIREALFGGSEPGRVAIVGLGRSGKSSLVYNVLALEDERRLLEQKYLPIWINVSVFRSGRDLLNNLVRETLRLLAKTGHVLPSIGAQGQTTRTCPEGEFPAELRAFFEYVRDEGFRPFVVLDEFDAARRVFTDKDGAEFNLLRELTYSGRHAIGMVIICRRPIWMIERRCEVSNLDQIFARKVRLRGFAPHEVDDILEDFASHLGGPSCTVDKLSRDILHWSGAWPFPLVNGVALAIELARRGHPMDEVRHRIDWEMRTLCTRHFEHTREFLVEELAAFGKLLQYFVGPALDVSPTDEDTLMQYGLLTRPPSGPAETMSAAFLAYLDNCGRNTSLWPLWTEAERALRRLVVRRLAERFGDAWESRLRTHPALAKAVGDMTARRDRETKITGNSGELLDYSYPSDLFDIIFSYWDAFVVDVGRTRAYWDERRKMLSRARTSLAHSRTLLTPDEQLLAQAYCGEIIRLVKGARLTQDA